MSVKSSTSSPKRTSTPSRATSVSRAKAPSDNREPRNESRSTVDSGSGASATVTLTSASDREAQREASDVNSLRDVAVRGGFADSTPETEVPDPSTPEYGEQLIEGMESVNPSIADGMRVESARRLSADETQELLDHVAGNAEIGGLDNFTQSLTKEDNGYLTGVEPETLANNLAANVVEGEAAEPNQVSQASIDGLIEQQPGFQRLYDRALAQSPPSEDAFAADLDVLAEAESVQTHSVFRSPDSPLEHTVSTPDGDTLQARTDLNGYNPLMGELQPGVTPIENGQIFTGTSGNGSDGRALSPEQAVDFAAEALAMAHESQEPQAQQFANRALAVVGGNGGAQQVADIYQELGLELPAYLSQALGQ